jgi:uncharacterized protein
MKHFGITILPRIVALVCQNRLKFKGIKREQAGMTKQVNSSRQSNPFEGKKARAHSSYAAWRAGKLVNLLNARRQISPLAASVHAEFRELVLDPEFPCLGAKAAIKHNSYRFGFYPQMNTGETSSALAYDLWEFVREQPLLNSDYTTFIAGFSGPRAANELEWEKLLWAQLQALHELDRRHHRWDSSASSDPEAGTFSFSFAELAFFVVGLYAGSSRQARQFNHQMLIFNPRVQFERLRERGLFERMRETIRLRDYKLQGSLNPNLSDFGEQSEARQYSGRAVEQNWRCPFRAAS